MGKCNHNEPIENFFSVMKPESYYGKVYRSYKELDRAIIDYNSLQ
ncbi:IS3 family transposase [Hutsoniella sourekii]